MVIVTGAVLTGGWLPLPSASPPLVGSTLVDPVLPRDMNQRVATLKLPSAPYPPWRRSTTLSSLPAE